MDVMVDFYPSRLEPYPTIRPRRDPVVHGRLPHADGLLAETLEQYRRDGFLSFDSFLARDALDELSDEMDRLREEATDDDPRVLREPASQSLRTIFSVHKQSALVDRLIRDPRLLGPVRQILGGPVYVHQSRVNYKSGFDGAPFYWHSDFEAWHVEDGMPRMRAVSAQITLSETTPLNGPLMLIPGSHFHYVGCVGETLEDYGVPDRASLAALVKESGGIVSPIGPAGTMVLFDCNTIHGSNSNITPLPQTSLFITFNSVENRLAPPYGGTRPRPSYIAERDGEELV